MFSVSAIGTGLGQMLNAMRSVVAHKHARGEGGATRAHAAARAQGAPPSVSPMAVVRAMAARSRTRPTWHIAGATRRQPTAFPRGRGRIALPLRATSAATRRRSTATRVLYRRRGAPRSRDRLRRRRTAGSTSTIGAARRARSPRCSSRPQKWGGFFVTGNDEYQGRCACAWLPATGFQYHQSRASGAVSPRNARGCGLSTKLPNGASTCRATGRHTR